MTFTSEGGAVDSFAGGGLDLAYSGLGYNPDVGFVPDAASLPGGPRPEVAIPVGITAAAVAVGNGYVPVGSATGRKVAFSEPTSPLAQVADLLAGGTPGRHPRRPRGHLRQQPRAHAGRASSTPTPPRRRSWARATRSPVLDHVEAAGDHRPVELDGARHPRVRLRRRQAPRADVDAGDRGPLLHERGPGLLHRALVVWRRTLNSIGGTDQGGVWVAR